VKYYAFGDNQERTYVDLKVIPRKLLSGNASSH
jgi:hypothetical protein